MPRTTRKGFGMTLDEAAAKTSIGWQMIAHLAALAPDVTLAGSRRAVRRNQSVGLSPRMQGAYTVVARVVDRQSCGVGRGCGAAATGAQRER